MSPLDQAWLFDDPDAYVAGVEDTLRAVRQLPVGEDHTPEPPAADLIVEDGTIVHA